MRKEMSRRSFLKTSAGFGAVAMGTGLLAGCSNQAPSDAQQTAESPAEGAEAGKAVRYEPSKTMETDLVICGGGISGLAAAVQAADEGMRAILVEKAGEVGGNGSGVEGVFAVGSAAQIEQGIEVDPGEVLRHELEFAQSRPDGALWRDLIESSPDNYDWLVSHGVRFSGLVNDYGGLFPTMHWFDGDIAGIGYVPPMKEAAEAGGVEIMVDTAAKQLVMEDGKVAAVIVDNNGEIVRIDAKAVIVATGGFGSNKDLIAKVGWPVEHMSLGGTPGHDGDGLTMCLEAGAADTIADSCSLCALAVTGLDGRSMMSSVMSFGGPLLWVNGDGERCVNEDLSTSNMMTVGIPLQTQRVLWCVTTEGIIDQSLESDTVASAQDTGTPPKEELAAVVEACPDGNIFRCDTVRDCAEKAGLDPDALEATVARYNELCAKGKDDDFCKDPSLMVPLEEGPFYIYRLDPDFVVSIGGISTDRSMRVLDTEGNPIEGLYAIGTDGVRLYRHVYPINCGATCCGNNVHSGRVAVRHVAENLL